MTTTQKIYLRPAPRTSSQGLTTKSVDTVSSRDMINDTGVTYQAQRSTIKRGQAKNTIMSLPVSGLTGNFIVFGQDLVDNPYHKSKIAVPSEWLDKESYLRNTPMITQQMFYELKHNAVPNTYNVKRNDFTVATGRRPELVTYFEKISRPFYDGLNVLDTSNPIDEIWYLAIKESAKNITSKFASSIEEMYERPNCAFYIVDEAIEDAMEVNQYELYDATIGKISELNSKFTAKVRYQLAVVLDLVNTHTLSDDKIKKVLRDYVKRAEDTSNNAKKEQSQNILKSFNRYFDMYSDANYRIEFNTIYLVKECQNQGILIKKENEFIWIPSGENSIAESLGRWESLLKKLQDKKNVDILTELKEQLQRKGITFE